MANNSVIWFEIYMQDLQRAQAFYEAVLQIKLDTLDTPVPGMAMRAFPGGMSDYGANGALVQMEGVPSGGTGTLVYFGCADCAVEGKRVAAAGGRIEREKMSIGEYGFIVLAHDTEGNQFGLHSMQ